MNANCKMCGHFCDDIGEANKIGVSKQYCCKCYKKYYDKGFGKVAWCKECLERVL